MSHPPNIDKKTLLGQYILLLLKTAGKKGIR
jgi:hypothetical protein